MNREERGEISGNNPKDPEVMGEQEEGQETKETDEGGQKKNKNINYTHIH